MGNASASVSLQITARDVLTSGLSRGVIPIQFAKVLELNNGLTDASIDLVFTATRVGMAASGTTTMDLHGGLQDSFGNTVQFAEVVLIALCNNRADAGAYLLLSPAALTPFGRLSASKGFWPADLGADADQGSIIAPLAWLCLCDPSGVPTVAGVTDTIAITTSAVVGATNGWSILILGRSA
jgi:ribose/xylose/arabinose/galactoside ABC-type transport system permease subunit